MDEHKHNSSDGEALSLNELETLYSLREAYQNSFLGVSIVEFFVFGLYLYLLVALKEGLECLISIIGNINKMEKVIQKEKNDDLSFEFSDKESKS